MGNKTALIADFAQNKLIPNPHTKITDIDRAHRNSEPVNPEALKIYAPYDRLSKELQAVHVWAMSQPALSDAESSEREWSPEYLAKWRKKSQAGSLENLPIIVLARKEGGFRDTEDKSAAQMETERKLEQAGLASLSSRGKLRFVESGHEIHLDAPDEVAKAVREIVEQVRP
jgi:hypothetical protein